MEAMYRHRKLYIDMAKGLSMLFIIAGHLGVNEISSFVFTFHVPIYLLISGYLYTYRPNTLRSKVMRYLKPYLFASVVIILLSTIEPLATVIKGEVGIGAIKPGVLYWMEAALYGSGSRTDGFGYTFPYIGAIWFFLALAWAIAIMHVMMRFDCGKIASLIIVLSLFVVAVYSSKWTWLPFSIQAGLSSLLFVYAGYELKLHKHRTLHKSKRLIFTMSMLAWGVSLYFSYTRSHLSIVSCDFPNPVVNIIGALGASYVIIVLCKKAERITFIRVPLCYLGRYSAIVLCFHLIEIKYMQWNPWNHTIDAIVSPYPLAITAIMCCKILWAFLAVYTVNKVRPLKYFFS